jgi:hypothetical protein
MAEGTLLAFPSGTLRPASAAALTVLWITGAAQVASAYEIKSASGSGCHESITAEALRMVRTEFPESAAGLTVTEDERALIDDLQFVPDPDMRDLGGATLMIAVRDNDLKGRGANDLTMLGEIHGDPAGQREHCLRHPDQIEPGGSEAALNDCRGFIRTRVGEALDGLDSAGNVDLAKRTELAVHLALRGDVDAALPTFYVRIGQALHAIEDSFTHTYRTADGKRVTVVMNWVKFVEGEHDEARDGPQHARDLDVCENLDDLLQQRHQLAMMATTAVLRASLDPDLTREQKLAAVDAVLTEYLSFEPGCTAANGWCNAPEAAYADSSSCACQETKVFSGSANSFWLFILLGVAVIIRSRNKHLLLARASFLALVIIALPSTARADEETKTSTAPKPRTDDEGQPLTAAEQEAIPAPPTKPVAEPGSHDPEETTYGLYFGLSGSVDKTALAGTIAGRMRLAKSWTFGLDAEWNPWINMNTKSLRAGTANLFLTAIFRVPLYYEDFNLRITGNLGTSYLLTSLYGAPAGSVGLYLGLSPLGLEWKLSRLFYLIINPINISMPIPQLRGVPLTYPQYRFSIGLELDV